MSFRMKLAFSGLFTACVLNPLVAQQIIFHPETPSTPAAQDKQLTPIITLQSKASDSTSSISSSSGISEIRGQAASPVNLDCSPDIPLLFGTSPHGSTHKFYGRIEYLLMDLSHDYAPPLVTTGTQGCALGQPGVEVLYGNRLEQDLFSGGRITAGMWLDVCENNGLEASFFTMEQRQTNFFAYSPGNPMLARPFYNISPINFDGTPRVPGEDCELVAKEGVLSGSVEVEHSTQFLVADLNWRHLLCASSNSCSSLQWHVDSFAGLKYLQLNEELTVTERLLTGPGFGFPGVRFLLVDRFSTQNHFLAVNLGL